MAGIPNWWNIINNNMRSPPPTTTPSLPIISSSWHDNQQPQESWSQLLLGGLVGEEDKGILGNMHARKLESWEDEQKNSSNSYNFSHGFCKNKSNSTATGGALKKARVQPSSTSSTLIKVRKEKLGDRITALHQIVSPFGKTDTASVLLEAIGYIRFLQTQIEALSLPYLGSGSGNMRPHQHPGQGGMNCLFPEDPGQDFDEEPKDLRSRGLCLVPISCTLHIGSDNGADYWAPSLGGGFR